MGLGSFNQWSVCHTSRQNNVAAHLMAREARSFPECRIWMEDTPPVIAGQVQLDVICKDSFLSNESVYEFCYQKKKKKKL